MRKICKGMSRSVLAGVSSVLLLSVGCGEIPDAEATDDAVSRTVGADTTVDSLRILLSDNRTATNGILTVRDSSGNTDSEAVRATLYPPADFSSDPANETDMSWSSNFRDRLSLAAFGPGSYPLGNKFYSNINVAKYTGTSRMRVTLRVYIAGNCHEDFEDIDWIATQRLYFNGNGGTWDGSCFRGNFLRTTP